MRSRWPAGSVFTQRILAVERPVLLASLEQQYLNRD